jgi:hypothetical protein
MSNVTIREAILRAADHIEANPGEFDFWSARTPDHPGCGTPGCALGWIQSFHGFRVCVGHGVFSGAAGALGVDEGDFYERMMAFDRGWYRNAKRCACALRLYADKHHPAASPAIESGTWSALAGIWQPKACVLPAQPVAAGEMGKESGK